MNCNEAVFRVQKVSLGMFWEHSPGSVKLASDWLRAKRVLLRIRKNGLKTKRKMDDDVDISLASEGTNPFVDLWEAQPSLGPRMI